MVGDMRCSVVDKFSYGEVSVTSRRLTITSKGIDGGRLSECPPLVLNRRRKSIAIPAAVRPPRR
jgi:hypothetical protein